jgi:guanylate kinase
MNEKREWCMSILDEYEWKEINYIFGGNGSGKTTLSRQILKEDKKDEALVFNIDFISKNVYTMKVDGNEIDTKNNDNITELFLGEQSVEIAKERDKLALKKKEIDSVFANKINELNIELGSHKLETINNLEIKGYFNSIYLKNKNDDSIIEEIGMFQLDTAIKNNDEFEKQIELRNENSVLKHLFVNIKNNLLLNNLFLNRDLDSFKSLNGYIEKYNELISNQKEYINPFKRDGVDEAKYRNWVDCGLKLSKGIDDCLFCDNKDIQDKIISWREILDDSLNTIKSKIEETIKNMEKSILTICDGSEIEKKYIKWFPSVYEKALHYRESLVKISEKIAKSETAETIDFLNTNELEIEENDNSNELKKFVLNKFLKDILLAHNECRIVNERLDAEKKALEEVYDSNISNLIDTTNLYLNELGLDKDFKLILDRASGKRTIRISLGENKEKKINWSEGEIHKLALALFFTKLSTINNNVKYVVFDDPIVSLDVSTYFKFKKVITSFESQETLKESKLFIMTHNYYFLMVMLSNLLQDNNLTKRSQLFSIYNRGSVLKSIPMSTLAIDDITLFKIAYLCLEDNQKYKLGWVALKIVRFFLDLKARDLGSFLFCEVKDQLMLIFEVEEKRKRVQKLFNELKGNTEKCNEKSPEYFEKVLENAKTILSKLGIGDIFNFDPLKQNKDDSDINIERNKFVIEIIEKGYEMLYGENENENDMMLSYLRHPRFQITESLVAIFSFLDN